MISGYVIGKLGALPIEDAVMDCSFTSWTGLADVKNRCWSEEICGEIGLDRKYLPRIVDSNYVCGHLCREMAAVTGLKEGIPLVSGAGDKIAGCLGVAAVHPGQMVFEASSYDRDGPALSAVSALPAPGLAAALSGPSDPRRDAVGGADDKPR